MSESSRLEDGADYLGRDFDEVPCDECVDCFAWINCECDGNYVPCKNWTEVRKR